MTRLCYGAQLEGLGRQADAVDAARSSGLLEVGVSSGSGAPWFVRLSASLSVAPAGGKRFADRRAQPIRRRTPIAVRAPGVRRQSDRTRTSPVSFSKRSAQRARERVYVAAAPPFSNDASELISGTRRSPGPSLASAQAMFEQPRPRPREAPGCPSFASLDEFSFALLVRLRRVAYAHRGSDAPRLFLDTAPPPAGLDRRRCIRPSRISNRSEPR